MKRHFDEDGYPCDAISLDGANFDAWFYVQKEGLMVCADGCKHCGRQRMPITIPWRKIKSALADREKAKGRRS